MKFPMVVTCPSCKKCLVVEAEGSKPYPNPRCECGATIYLLQSDMRVSRRVFCRAEVELSDEDFSLAIILSAMAVECELAFLFSKWKQLEARLLPNEVTQAHTNLWGQEFRKLKGVSGKLDAATLLMTGETFDAFLMRRADLASWVKQNHPNIGNRSASKFFVEELFRRRNKILHSGHTEFGKLEAEPCVKMATTLLRLIAEIDKERYTRFDEELKTGR
jgi:hypothetical protein